MNRRDFLKSISVGAIAVAMPSPAISEDSLYDQVLKAGELMEAQECSMLKVNPEGFSIGDKISISGVQDTDGNPFIFTVKSLSNNGVEII